ncbi:MAG TPA: site-2 protease family protein [Terriglobales bacterium]|nr:site-2 protease family protein [Terriglobales bacterium]
MALKTWSIPIGKILGVEIRVHLAFLFLLFFILLPSMDPTVGPGAGKGLVLFFIFLIAVVAHEIGHLAMAQLKGKLPRAIMLLPIGGVAIQDSGESEKTAPERDEVIIALAGPVTSLMVGAVSGVVLMLLHPEMSLLTKPFITAADPMRSVVWVNLFLGALNLIPAYPLDGGRVLRVLLLSSSDREMDFATATRRVVNMGQVFATFLIFAGIWNAWLMLVGFFLFLAVQIEDRSLMFHSVIESVKLEEIMLTDFSTLSPADTLEDALQKAVHSLQDDFPVIRGSDMVGVISRQAILRALRDQGNGYVQSAMQRVFEIGSRSDSLAAAFRKITVHNSTIIPVVDESRLVGIVTLQNLMHSMGLLAESRKLKQENAEVDE